MWKAWSRQATLSGWVFWKELNDFTFSSDGTLVYFQPTLGSSLVWVDRQGGVELLAETQKNAFSPRLSPDGTRLLMVRLRSLSLDQLAASERLIS